MYYFVTLPNIFYILMGEQIQGPPLSTGASRKLMSGLPMDLWLPWDSMQGCVFVHVCAYIPTCTFQWRLSIKFMISSLSVNLSFQFHVPHTSQSDHFKTQLSWKDPWLCYSLAVGFRQIVYSHYASGFFLCNLEVDLKEDNTCGVLGTFLTRRS